MFFVFYECNSVDVLRVSVCKIQARTAGLSASGLFFSVEFCVVTAYDSFCHRLACINLIVCVIRTRAVRNICMKNFISRGVL